MDRVVGAATKTRSEQDRDRLRATRAAAIRTSKSAQMGNARRRHVRVGKVSPMSLCCCLFFFVGMKLGVLHCAKGVYHKFLKKVLNQVIVQKWKVINENIRTLPHKAVRDLLVCTQVTKN